MARLKRLVRYTVKVSGVIEHDGRYLMAVHNEKESLIEGTLSLIGGKVEVDASTNGTLELTLRLKIWEKVAVEVHHNIEYLQSRSFVADDGSGVIDIIFLCRYRTGTPTLSQPGETSAILWMTAQEVLSDSKTPSWIHDAIQHAEKKHLNR